MKKLTNLSFLNRELHRNILRNGVKYRMGRDNIEKIIEKGKEMLKSLSNNKSIDFEVFNSHIIVLRQVIALNPELSKEVGILIQKLLAAKKLYDVKFDLVQIPVLQGRLSIDHRPKIKEIPL